MIKSRHHSTAPPMVGWQGSKSKPYKLFRLEDLGDKKPPDGHDPNVPHRIGFHAMMLTTQGSFDHWLDFKTHRFARNQLIYIAPNQIHHFISQHRKHKTWLLIFRPEMLPSELLQMEADQASWSIMSYRWPSITKLKSNETKLLDIQLDYLNQLDLRHPKDYASATKFQVSSIVALAFEMASQRVVECKALQSNFRFFEFAQLVERSFTKRRDVKWYAKQLQCTQRTLNRACQNTNGKTAKVFLKERVVIEAKRMLIYRTDSVAAIAALLGFVETTNFVRFFRNETGMTPHVFRNDLVDTE